VQYLQYFSTVSVSVVTGSIYSVALCVSTESVIWWWYHCEKYSRAAGRESQHCWFVNCCSVFYVSELLGLQMWILPTEMIAVMN